MLFIFLNDHPWCHPSHRKAGSSFGWALIYVSHRQKHNLPDVNYCFLLYIILCLARFMPYPVVLRLLYKPAKHHDIAVFSLIHNNTLLVSVVFQGSLQQKAAFYRGYSLFHILIHRCFILFVFQFVKRLATILYLLVMPFHIIVSQFYLLVAVAISHYFIFFFTISACLLLF